MGSRERIALRLVLWLVEQYLSSRYRLMTPEGLNKVVDDYLAELPNLGLKIVQAHTKVGVDDDQVTHQHQSSVTEDDASRVSAS